MKLEIITITAGVIMVFKYVKSMCKGTTFDILSDGFVLLTLALLGRIYF